MCKCTITSNTFNVDVDLHPSQDFVSCLLTALFAALPTFLDSLVKCMAGAGTTDQYKPGSRERCQ